MFRGAKAYDQPEDMGGWDVRAVRDTGYNFYRAKGFRTGHRRLGGGRGQPSKLI